MAAQFIKSFAADDLQAAIPDDIVHIMGAVRLDALTLFDAANHDLDATIKIIFATEMLEQDADDFATVGQVHGADLALAAVHRGGVKVVAVGKVAADGVGELAVDIGVLHF